MLGAFDVGGAIVRQIAGAGNDFVYGSQGTQNIFGTEDDSGQANVAFL